MMAWTQPAAMDTLRLKPRQPVVDDIENWDDDDFLIDDDITFRSSGSNVTGQLTRRGSHSSFRSERESIQGEEQCLQLPDVDDEKSTLDAIAAAASAGIPLPSNITPSALMGGTIKRLGGRKIKKIIQEDWEDDLELPEPGRALRIKPQDGTRFPESLRQISSSTTTSPVKSTKPTLVTPEQKGRQSSAASSNINLDKYKDDDDDDDFFGDGADTIKVSKTRQVLKPVSLITPPTPSKNEGEDDFEADLELPSDGKLKLSTRKDIPKTPSLNTLEDFDWGEGSLGTRFGGTRRDGRSARSSSVSAMSPSIASSLTAESEDEAMDGLVLPEGPVDFTERLQKRRPSPSPERQPIQSPQLVQKPPPLKAALQTPTSRAEPEKEDFLSGLEIGNGEVFDSSKLTLHRNVKVKDTRTGSPSRPKTAASITFTNKSSGAVSRLPRPMGGHERTHTSSSLEPVSESGGPIPHPRRSQSRLGHSSQSSVTSLPTPTTPSSTHSMLPATPRRREIGHKTSNTSLHNEPTTTNAQLLRLKRSLPVMRAPISPARPPTRGGDDRPPSRSDTQSRPSSSHMRPKTPVERTRAGQESAAAQARRHPVPFFAGGASSSQSHHVMSKTSRTFHRHDPDTGMDLRPSSRAVSRSTMRSPSPSKRSRVERLAQESMMPVKPRRQRHFGDGNELDGFDDLATSAQAEARWIKQPASGTKAHLRNKMYQNIHPDRNTPSPALSNATAPYSPARSEYTPRFARDTAASRIARETSLAQRAPSNGPLAPLTTQRVAQLTTRNNFNNAHSQATVRSKKTPKRPPQLKPFLISNLTTTRETKTVKGMVYNPETYRWEGNDNALGAFDAPASSPSTASIPNLMRERENATPRPALITPIGATKGVQVVGGMVFDPQNMCWLKVGAPGTAGSEADPMDGFNALDDEDDVFKDIPDLEDTSAKAHDGANVGGRMSDIKDDWMVGEEFDVGPEFVCRQREEEAKWKKKCEQWLSPQPRDREAWRWTIREIVLGIQQ